VQEVGVLLEQQADFLFDSAFESLSVFFRNTVPELRLAPVVIVDRS
jgi:hypothetical protein